MVDELVELINEIENEAKTRLDEARSEADRIRDEAKNEARAIVDEALSSRKETDNPMDFRHTALERAVTEHAGIMAASAVSTASVLKQAEAVAAILKAVEA